MEPDTIDRDRRDRGTMGRYSTRRDSAPSIGAESIGAREGDGLTRTRRRRRAASVLPTLLTLGNAICGFAAIHYAAKPISDTPLGW